MNLPADFKLGSVSLMSQLLRESRSVGQWVNPYYGRDLGPKELRRAGEFVEWAMVTSRPRPVSADLVPPLERPRLALPPQKRPLCSICELAWCYPLFSPAGWRGYADECKDCAEAIHSSEALRYRYEREARENRQRWWARALRWLARL